MQEFGLTGLHLLGRFLLPVTASLETSLLVKYKRMVVPISDRKLKEAVRRNNRRISCASILHSLT
jgi:hypothetical protein